MKNLFQGMLLFLLFLIGCSKDENIVIQHSLDVEVNPMEGGSVSPTSGKFENGDVVTLTATPSGEYVFKNWSDGASGTDNPTTTIMDSDKTVTAVFEKRDYPLKVEIEGEGTVREESIMNSETNKYPSGTFVKLTAVPVEGWEFVKWSGDLFGVDNPSTISIDQPKNIKATFQPVLINQIIGKWDNTNNTETTGDACLVYSLVFDSDGSFILNLSSGEITGSYYFDSSTSLVLDNQGSLTNLSIENELLNFSLELSSLCSFDGSAEVDETYDEGECVAFLNCNDGKVWVNGTAENKTFIRLTNDLSNVWIERYSFDEGRQCMSYSMTNTASEFNVVLLENNTNRLTYVLDNTPDGDVSVIFSITADDHLAVKYDYTNNSLDETDYFSLVNDNSLNDFLNTYNECSQQTFVPDNNFEQALIDLGYDDVLDDYVLTSNIDKVESLVIIDKGITDLTGIEDFTSLIYLKTSDGALDYELKENANQITSIDVTQNTKLEYLDLGENRLKSLDVSKNPNLVFLEVQFNEITTLDLSSNPKLELLSAAFNQLKTIDISQNPNLVNFQVFSNELMSVDLSHNPKLKYVYVHNIPQSFYSYPYKNKLTSLDVSKNPNIKELYFRNNNIATIDVSQNHAMTLLVADNNQLTSLDLSNNGNLTSVFVNDNLLSRLDVSGNADLTLLNSRNNPYLTCIQIDEPQFTLFGDWAKDAGTRYSYDCSDLW